MTTTRSRPGLAALLLATASIALPGLGTAAEQPECITTPSVQDTFGFTHRIEVFLDIPYLPELFCSGE